MKKALIAGAVFVVLGAAGVGAYVFSQIWAARQVDAVLAQPPFTKASHGAVHYAPWRGHLEIEAVAVETSLAALQSFAADRLSVEGADFSAQRFAAVTATKAVTVTGSAESSDGTARTEIEELRVAGLNLPAWRPAEAPASGEPPVTALLDSLTLAKMTSVAGPSTAKINSMTIAGLKAPAGSVPGSSAAPDEWARFLRATRVDTWEMAGVSLALPDDRGMALTRLAVANLEPGRLGHAEVENLSVEFPGGRVQLGAVELDGLAYRLAETPAQWPRAFVGRLRLGDIAAGRGAGAEFSVKELLFTMEGSIDRATSAAYKIAAIDVPATLVPNLKPLGYDDLLVDYEGDAHFDVAAGKVESRFVLAAPTAGKVSFAMRLSNYPAAAPSERPGDLMVRFAQANLESLELHYEDASLVERLLKYDADRTHRDVEAVRDELIARLMVRSDASGGTPVLHANLERVAAFLRQPGAIALTLAPPRPVRLGDIATMASRDPEAAAQALGLEIR